MRYDERYGRKLQPPFPSANAIAWLFAIVGIDCALTIGDMRVNAEESSETRVSQDVQSADDRAKGSKSNLQLLAIGIANYEQARGHLPLAATKGRGEQSQRSWRVEILPFIPGPIDEKLGRPSYPYAALYERYNRDEAWDSEQNKKVLKDMPDCFRAPGDKKDVTSTPYLVPVGKGAVFEASRATKIAEIEDGSFDTILIIESNPRVPWTKPTDLVIDASKKLPKLGGLHDKGFFAADAAGGRHFIKNDIDQAQLRALISRNGREPQQFPD